MNILSQMNILLALEEVFYHNVHHPYQYTLVRRCMSLFLKVGYYKQYNVRLEHMVVLLYRDLYILDQYMLLCLGILHLLYILDQGEAESVCIGFHMDLRYNLGCIYIYLYGYEANNRRFAHNRMDQHIFHFYMLWW